MRFPGATVWLIAWIVAGVLIAILQVGVLRRLKVSPLIRPAPRWTTSRGMVALVFVLYGALTLFLTGYETARLVDGQPAPGIFLFIGAAVAFRGLVAFKRKMAPHWLIRRKKSQRLSQRE